MAIISEWTIQSGNTLRTFNSIREMSDENLKKFLEDLCNQEYGDGYDDAAKDISLYAVENTKGIDIDLLLGLTSTYCIRTHDNYIYQVEGFPENLTIETTTSSCCFHNDYLDYRVLLTFRATKITRIS